MVTNESTLTFFETSTTSLCVAFNLPNLILLRIVSLNIVVSWLTSDIAFRRLEIFIFEILDLPIVILPVSISYSLSIRLNIVDLPAPLSPTTAIVDLLGTLKEILFNASTPPSYEKETLLKAISESLKLTDSGLLESTILSLASKISNILLTAERPSCKTALSVPIALTGCAAIINAVMKPVNSPILP